MKDLVLYYSWKGNTEVVAREIAAATGAALCRIEEVKPPRSSKAGFMGAAFRALTARKSVLKPLGVNLTEYDRLFIGGPVWAGRTTPAINAFLDSTDLAGKAVYLFVTQADPAEPKAVFCSLSDRITTRDGKLSGSLFVQSVMGQVLSPDAVHPQIIKWVENGIN